MKKRNTIIAVLVMICLIFTACQKDYYGKYQLESVDELGYGAEFFLEIKSGKFEMIMENGDQTMVLNGSYKETQDNTLCLTLEKKEIMDADGNKSVGQIESNDEIVLVYKNNKLEAQDGSYSFVLVE